MPYRIALGVKFRRLDDEMVVYLSDSFETHLVDDVGGQILEAVLQMQSAAKPCSVPALFAWLSAGSDVQLDPEAEVSLLPLLDELARVGILTVQAW